MVSQMVSLNSLDQLISINQTLGSLTAGGTTTPGTSSTSGSASSASPFAAPSMAAQSMRVAPNAFTQTNTSAQGNGSSAGSPNPILSLASSPLVQIPAQFVGGGLPKAIMNLYSGFRNATPTLNPTHTGGR
jgi:hypothetical protein